jgi:hypothetical protein
MFKIYKDDELTYNDNQRARGKIPLSIVTRPMLDMFSPLYDVCSNQYEAKKSLEDRRPDEFYAQTATIYAGCLEYCRGFLIEDTLVWFCCGEKMPEYWVP